ncbi:MAG: hypothetical protein ACYC1Z_11090 [Georgenia sp.]
MNSSHMGPGHIGKSGIHSSRVGDDVERVDVPAAAGTADVVEWIDAQSELPGHLEFDLEAGSEASVRAITEASEARGIDAEFL